MKRRGFFLLMAFLAIMPGVLNAQQSVLEEGFETTSSGVLPAKWTMEPASSAMKWAVEIDQGNNLYDPAACASGKGRVKFISGGGGSKGEVMLISPEVNTTELSEPILVFDYAAIMHAGGVVDTLKVYYRLRSDRQWVLARSYGEADNWRRDTIDFTQKSATMQVAFGGVDNGGRGVALDNIKVTSRPICKEVTNVEIYNKIHNEAKMRWAGSLTSSYNIKIATQELADPATATEAEGLYITERVDYKTSLELNAGKNKALISSTTYYYYIQSDCGYGDVSAWVSGSFTTACDPVQSFATSFDAEEDMACWVSIGESHGTWKATAPTNSHNVPVYEGIDDITGNEIWMDFYQIKKPKPYSGESALWMNVGAEGDDFSRVYAVSPRLADDVDMKEMQLTFQAMTNTKKLHLRVVVSDWPDDFSNIEDAGEISLKSEGIYESITLSFEDIKSKGKYVVFMIDGSEERIKQSAPQMPFMAIDDITFEPKQACDADTKVGMFAAPDVSGTTAKISWNRNGAAKWNVKVGTSVMNPGTDKGIVFDGQIDTLGVTLKDLLPATRYIYYVQPICADGVKGKWSNAQWFDTECLADGVEIPFREDFDDIEASDAGVGLPICWTEKSVEGNNAYITPSDYAKSLYNYVTCYTNSTTYVISPKINAEMKNCQVRFAYSINQRQQSLVVGIMSDPNDDATFTAIEEILMPEDVAYNDYKWQEKTVRFENYTGNGQYVAFKFTTPDVTYKLDDILIEDMSSCGEPSNFKVTGATTTSLTFSWQPSDHKETQWSITYGKKGATFGLNTKEVGGIVEPTYELKGLEENTEYDIYIRSVCAPDALGSWVGPIQAKTISPATVPYKCDFEDATTANAWTLKNGTQENAWIIGGAVKDETNTVTGDKAGTALYMSSDYGMNNTAVDKETYVYALRLFELKRGLYDFEFDWRLPGGSKTVYDDNGCPKQKCNAGAVIPFLVPEEIEIEGGVQYSLYHVNMDGYGNGTNWEIAVPEGWILLDSLVLASETDEWQHFKSTYQLRNDGRYNLVLASLIDNYESGLKPAAIDNVAVSANTTTCPRPEDIRVFDITQTSAKVEFLCFNADQWKVVVTTDTLKTTEEMEAAKAGDENTVFAGTKDKNPLEITGLTADTYYNVYFRPMCADAEENWAWAGFTTICASADVPLRYDFDAENSDGQTYGSNDFMLCWRRMPAVTFRESWDGSLNPTSKSGAYVVIDKFPSHLEMSQTNITNMLHFSTSSYSAEGTPYIASPEMLPDVKALQLSFRAVNQYDYADKPYEIEVGVMTDPLDSTTFELIETVAPRYAGQWKRYNVYFDGYTGAGKYIAMRVPRMEGHSGTIYVDDMEIDSISGCVPPREITVENITASSADVSWRVVGDMGTYHVKVSTEPIGRWEDEANVYDDAVSGDNKLQLKDLRSSRMYYIYVRTSCGDGTYSDGMSEGSFRTACGAEEVLPYYENFESYELNSVPDCWTVVQQPSDGGVKLLTFNNTTVLDQVYKSIGKLSMSLSSDKYFATIAAMPVMGAESVSELTLSFKGLAGGDNLIVGVISDLNDPETFAVVDTCKVPVNYEWTDFRVDFSKYKGNGKHIAFYVESSYFGQLFYIDELIVRKTSVVCADATKPQVLNVTSNSATVRWADNPSVASFELKVSTEEINPEIDDADVINGDKFTALSAQLDDLLPSQKYYVYMRNMCDGNSAGYWSDAVTFLTQCATPESIPYNEAFDGFGAISDIGYFPECWRNRVITYGSISPADQTAPYVENAVKPSLFMKAVYDEKDNAYAVVDVATPVIDFGKAGAAGHYMEVTVKSSATEGPVYIGMMSDPSDASTFVAYDTIRVNKANEWEKHIVNFIYHDGGEKHIAFRVNSLDAGVTYQVNITDIHVDELEDCMPPFRVRADIRPNKAFITWMPGDKVNTKWKYYIGRNKMDNVPFTDEEWDMNNGSEDFNIVDETSERSVTVNGLRDWSDYYFYIRTAGDGCNEFYPQPIFLSQDRGVCSKIKWEELPISTDFSNDGFGTEDPYYSAFPDCWGRTDDYAGDSVSYPYITADSVLWFKSVADTLNYAYLPGVDMAADSIIAKSQIRFTAKSLNEGAQVIVGVGGHYTEGWPAQDKYRYLTTWDTITLTGEYEEYTVKFEGYKWAKSPEDMTNYKDIRIALTVNKGGEYKIDELTWEPIPYCFTPDVTLKSYDKTGFSVYWEKLDDQDHWEVMYGEAGFDPAEGNVIPRTDTTYTVVNQKEGTPYEFYVRSNCGNGMSSEWGRMSVTTRQTPAVYPYESGNLSDGTVIDADTICYAYRTIDIPAGPHKLSFDWKLANDAAAWLRVFVVPESVMITADSDFGLTEASHPENWTEIVTLKGETTWKSGVYDMYVRKADEGAVNVVFVWFKSGTDVSETIRNVKTSGSTACTVPEELSASSITATSAVLSWVSYNATAWDMNFYETASPDKYQSLFDVTPGYVLKDLKPDTEYSFQVMSQCRPGDLSEAFTFRTACAPVEELYETFDEGVIDNCWKQYHGLFDEVTADPTKLKAVEEVWEITDKAVLGSTGTPHAKLTVAGDDCANWLVSPAIILNEQSALSFDLALTAYGAQGPVANENGQADDRFMVVISDDEGRTWKSANATIWDNAKGLNNSYNRIGNKSSRIEVDLSAFTGKTIRIGFYGESTAALESNDVHIDSVRIDCREKKALNKDVCQGYSYYANGFEVSKEETNMPGVRQFTRVQRSTTGGCDTTYILNLTINQGYEIEYDANICSDALPYVDENFKEGLTETDTYIKTYPAANGCDSVVILHLVVNEAYKYDRKLEIYDYELPYTYECRTFDIGTKSGTYEVNCPTAAGCDSIINLTLTVEMTNDLGNVIDGSRLFLVPNPVKMGATVTVDYDFTSEDVDNIRVEVFNSAGMLADVFNRRVDNIQFDAPDAAGVYIVRIKTASGKTLTGRLIVE